jgi:predicted nuclease with TOPRIM domain
LKTETDTINMSLSGNKGWSECYFDQKKETEAVKNELKPFQDLANTYTHDGTADQLQEWIEDRDDTCGSGDITEIDELQKELETVKDERDTSDNEVLELTEKLAQQEADNRRLRQHIETPTGDDITDLQHQLKWSELMRCQQLKINDEIVAKKDEEISDLKKILHIFKQNEVIRELVIEGLKAQHDAGCWSEDHD